MRPRNAFSMVLPRRFLRGSYVRSTLAILALTAGVALVCAMDLVSRAVLGAFVEVVDTMAGRAALTVGAGGAPLPEETVDRVAPVPGVELAVPVVSATAFTADASGELLTVHGVDITSDAAVRVYEARDAGGLEIDEPLAFLNQPDSVVATKSFARARGLDIGDSLELLTPTGRRTVIVRGLLEPQGIARVYGGNLLVMDLFAAQRAFLRPGLINRIDVVVARNAHVDEVAAAVARELPDGVSVELPAQRKADLHRVMESLQTMLAALSIVGLAAAFFIILNRLTTLFESRSWQLGVLRAVGMRSRTLWWELLKEALLLGSAGVALGIPLGIWAGRLLLPVVAATAALNFKLVAVQTDLAVNPRSMLVAAALGLGTAILAAALPAAQAARRPPVETMRGRGLGTEPRFAGHWLVRALIIAAIGGAIALQEVTRTPVWGLVATALIVVGAAAAARPLLVFVAPVLLSALRRVAGPSANIARGTFARNSGRAVLTIAMIGVGIGAIVWLRILAFSFESSLVQALSGALQGDWVVTSAHVTQGYIEAPVDEQLVHEVRAVAGVGEAIGERLVDWQHAGGPIAIDAFDPAYFTTAAFGRWPLVGAADDDVWEAVSAGRAALVSSNFAINLGAAAGDTLTLATPRGPLALRVAGVTINFSSPRGTVVLSRELYRRYWDDPQITRVFVRGAPGAAPAVVREAIAGQLGLAYGLRIISAADLMRYFAGEVRRAFAPVDVLAGLLLFVLMIGLADTLAASVLERMRDLAVVRTFGARRALVRRAVIVEGLSLGIPGLLLAVAAGLALGALWVQQTFPYLLGWDLQTHIPWAQLAVVASVTLAVCWVAGLLPAWRAGALSPAAALRYE